MLCYSKEDGFYFDTMAASHVGLQHALTIGLAVNIQNLDVMDQLGFLDVHITPSQSTPPFAGAAFSFFLRRRSPEEQAPCPSSRLRRKIRGRSGFQRRRGARTGR